MIDLKDLEMPLPSEEDKLYQKLEPTGSQWIAMRLSLIPIWVSIIAEQKICKEIGVRSFNRNLLGEKVNITAWASIPTYEAFFEAMITRHIIMENNHSFQIVTGLCGGVQCSDFIQPLFR